MRVLAILIYPHLLLEKYPKLCALVAILVSLNMYFKWYTFWNSELIQIVTVLFIFSTLFLNKMGIYF